MGAEPLLFMPMYRSIGEKAGPITYNIPCPSCDDDHAQILSDWLKEWLIMQVCHCY